MSKELIRLRDLCMAFDDELVLDHINLYINDSEFLTLLGPSGCGKTTIIKLVNEQMWPKTDADIPSFKAGDTITVSYKIVEGNKERVQSFRGVVIQIKGQGKTKMFTIRKVSNGVGVERIFPLYSPHIEKIEVNKIGVVRRARIYYLRDLTGKKARIKEKRMTSSEK